VPELHRLREWLDLHDAAAAADVALQVGDVLGLAAGVDDEEELAEARGRVGRRGPYDHQVVEQAAGFVGEEGVALAAFGQAQHVHWHQRLERRGSVDAFEPQLALVRHIEERRRLAAVPVFGHQAGGVLHGHGVARKGHHAGAEFEVQCVQRGLEQGGVGHAGQGVVRAGVLTAGP
jgi:hypothetical protein